MDKDRLIDLLNELIEISKDGQEGFLEAAERVKSPELKKFFSDESEIRGHMLRDLQAEVLRLGGEPDWQGTVRGAIERTWLELKEIFGAGDQAVLDILETEEDHAIKAYEKTLKEPLPQNLLSLIHNQYVSIKAVRDHIHVLRSSGKYRTKTA